MNAPILFRKMLEMAEAEAAKRGLADAPSRVERIIVQAGKEVEKAVRAARQKGASQLIVRVIVAPRFAELAPFPDRSLPGPASGPVASVSRGKRLSRLSPLIRSR